MIIMIMWVVTAGRIHHDDESLFESRRRRRRLGKHEARRVRERIGVELLARLSILSHIMKPCELP